MRLVRQRKGVSDPINQPVFTVSSFPCDDPHCDNTWEGLEMLDLVIGEEARILPGDRIVHESCFAKRFR